MPRHSMKSTKSIPENHPLRQLFRTLTERALIKIELRDTDLLFYLARLLVDFTFVENLHRFTGDGERQGEYLIGLLQQANETEMPDKKTCYKHIGDFSLFMLGMFPEYIARRRSVLSANYYSDFGRIGYKAAGQLESDSWRIETFRKLADEFEPCVESLRRVREYTTDPFYQYMLRQFKIT